MIPSTVNDLKAHPRNPRKITPEALTGLHRSMDEFGPIHGIVFNVQSGRLVAGHQRLKKFAADTPISGYREATDEHGTVGYGTIHADGADWDVRFVSWDEPMEMAALVVANSPNLGGQFSESIISILEDLKIEVPELVGPLLFEELRIDLDAQFDELAKGRPDIDVQDPGPGDLPENPVSEPGGLYELGRHVRCPKCGKLNAIKAGR